MIDQICLEVIKQLKLCTFVETGTDMGETVAKVAEWFSAMDTKFGKIDSYVNTGARSYSLKSELIKYPVFRDVDDSRYKIFSVDIDPYSFKTARSLFETNANIRLFCENSPEFLKRLVNDNVFKNSNAMFFLDAHWGKDWPLREELRQILRLDRFVVVIDDFFVPRRSNRARPHRNFGFDFYGGKILDWGYINDLFSSVDVRVYYPLYPNRDGRGFVLFFKGYNTEELYFLKNMPLECIDKNDPIHINPVPLSPLAYLDFRSLVCRIIPLPLLRGSIRIFQKLVH